MVLREKQAMSTARAVLWPLLAIVATPRFGETPLGLKSPVLPAGQNGSHTDSTAMKRAISLACICASLLEGCASVGPSTVVRDRFDYVTAISDSWKRQTLLNLLKVRYADAPVFMDVGSVINAYSLEGDISFGGQYGPPGAGNTWGAAAATGRYSDKPTITYQPLSGDRFARNVMAAIPTTAILYLIQSGYPADVVLRICVNSINGLENAYGGPANPRAGDPKFRELMTALRESQDREGTGFRVRVTKEGQTVVMYIRPSNDETAERGRRIRELLGLDATAREFDVVSGSFPERDTEIAILTRSILQIMVDLAAYIDVPAVDIAEGRVYSPQRTAEQQRMFPPLLKVLNGISPPEDAYAPVRYRGQWFWIDDRDPHSKSVLMFLMMQFSLTEGATTQPAPLVTIPAR
jgi:hypothetical protein